MGGAAAALYAVAIRRWYGTSLLIQNAVPSPERLP